MMFRPHRGTTILIVLFVLVWSLLPVYQMVVLSLTPSAETFTGKLWPQHPTLDNFRTVLSQNHLLLRHFWLQLWNSIFVGLSTALLVLVVATLTSYSVVKLRSGWGRHLSRVALVSYFVPAAFLSVPLYAAMGKYGLLNSQWALIFSLVAFSAPYAIWVLCHYAQTIPGELDEAAAQDGASAVQIFFLIYLPLMRPILLAIGTHALLVAWNEYLYAFMMLSSETQQTIPVMLGYFLVTDDAPWNLLMATSIIYALPPIAIYYAARQYMVAGLVFGAVKK